MLGGAFTRADAARAIGEGGIAAVAIAFLHSYANPVHERRAEGVHARPFLFPRPG
jgi:N-methylhydantoinase A/oxoprolinase/acetone carboxylase beta subunit